MKKILDIDFKVGNPAEMAETYTHTHTHTHTLLDSVAEQKNPRRPVLDDAGCGYAFSVPRKGLCVDMR